MNELDAQRIKDTLIALGASSRTKGFRFFNIGIRLYVENVIHNPGILHQIYKLIAAMTGETVVTVERNMHDTLNAGWPNRDKELAKTIFSRFLQSEADVPCVTLYTSMIGEWILMDIPESIWFRYIGKDGRIHLPASSNT